MTSHFFALRCRPMRSPTSIIIWMSLDKTSLVLPRVKSYLYPMERRDCVRVKIGWTVMQNRRGPSGSPCSLLPEIRWNGYQKREKMISHRINGCIYRFQESSSGLLPACFPMHAVKCVTKVWLHNNQITWHGLNDVSCGMNCCLTRSCRGAK